MARRIDPKGITAALFPVYVVLSAGAVKLAARLAAPAGKKN